MTIQSKPWFYLTPLPDLQQSIDTASDTTLQSRLRQLSNDVETSLSNSDSRWFRGHSVFSEIPPSPQTSILPGQPLHRHMPISLGYPGAKAYLDKPNEYLNDMELAGVVTNLYASSWMMEGAARLPKDEFNHDLRKEHYQSCLDMVDTAITHLKQSTKKSVGDPDPKLRPKVILMGIGAGYEHDLKQLLQDFSVVLVDMNRYLIETTIANLPEELKPYVSGIVEDITGGDVTQATLNAKEILDHRITSGNLGLTLTKLANYFQKPTSTSSLDFSRFDGDLIISSLLITQVNVHLTNLIVRGLNTKFPNYLDFIHDDDADQYNRLFSAYEEFTKKIQWAHTHALEATVQNREDRIVCYISDIAQLDRYKPVTENGALFPLNNTISQSHAITDFFMDGIATYVDQEMTSPETDLIFTPLKQFDRYELSALFHMRPDLNIVSGKNWKEHHHGADERQAGTIEHIEIQDLRGTHHTVLALKGTYRLMSGVVIQGKAVQKPESNPSLIEKIKKWFGLA